MGRRLERLRPDQLRRDRHPARHPRPRPRLRRRPAVQGPVLRAEERGPHGDGGGHPPRPEEVFRGNPRWLSREMRGGCPGKCAEVVRGKPPARPRARRAGVGEPPVGGQRGPAAEQGDTVRRGAALVRAAEFRQTPSAAVAARARAAAFTARPSGSPWGRLAADVRALRRPPAEAHVGARRYLGLR